MLRLFIAIFLFCGLVVLAQGNEEYFIEVEGLGKAPEGKPLAQQKLLAKRASQVVALRNLKEALLRLADVEEKDFPGLEVFMTLYTMEATSVQENGDTITKVSLSKRQVLSHYRALWDELMQQKEIYNVLLQQKEEQEGQLLTSREECAELVKQKKEMQTQFGLELQKKHLEVLQEQKKQEKQKEVWLAQRVFLNEKIELYEAKFAEEKKRFEDAYVLKQQEIEILQKQLEVQKQQHAEEIFQYKNEFHKKIEELRGKQTPTGSFDALLLELQELNGVVKSLHTHLEQLNKDVQELKETHK